MNIVKNNTEIKLMGSKGVGLIATRNFFIGDFITKCPAKKFDNDSRRKYSSTDIYRYLFIRPGEESKNTVYLVCGEIVFLNHSESQNIEIEWKEDNYGVFWLFVYAKTQITEGDELVYRYTNAEEYDDITCHSEIEQCIEKEEFA